MTRSVRTLVSHNPDVIRVPVEPVCSSVSINRTCEGHIFALTYHDIPKVFHILVGAWLLGEAIVFQVVIRLVTDAHEDGPLLRLAGDGEKGRHDADDALEGDLRR